MAMKDTQMRDLLSKLVTTMGYEYVGCELHSQGRGSVLRIFIDHENGITVDDCSRVSRQVSAMLDVEDPIQGQYDLEVSSPGLDRPLFELAHYQKYVGSRVKIRVRVPLEERRNFVGTLTRVDGENIHVVTDEKEVVLSFTNIDKAKIIAEI